MANKCMQAYISDRLICNKDVIFPCLPQDYCDKCNIIAAVNEKRVSEH